MRSFDEIDLSLVGFGQWNKEDLYCIPDSPLQNTTLFPGCYGICANPDVSGIGNRISLYIQTLLTLWLATLTPDPVDTLGAMLAAIAASFTVFVATLVQYGYSNITFHHTVLTINLSNLPTIAFFAGILRLRLLPGAIPIGPKLFATPILLLQFLASGVSIFLGVGLNSVLGRDDISGRGGTGWQVAQPQCNGDTQVVIFGRNFRFWDSESLSKLQKLDLAERIVIMVVYGLLLFLPMVSSFVLLYWPETGLSRAFKGKVLKTPRHEKIGIYIFLVLATAWAGILILVTEIQIKRNHVLPGENTWGAGQVLALLLTIIPLLGCISIALQSLGNHSPAMRRRIRAARLDKLFALKFDDDDEKPKDDEEATPLPTSRGSNEKRDHTSEDEAATTVVPVSRRSSKLVKSRPTSTRSPTSPSTFDYSLANEEPSRVYATNVDLHPAPPPRRRSTLVKPRPASMRASSSPDDRPHAEEDASIQKPPRSARRSTDTGDYFDGVQQRRKSRRGSSRPTSPRLSDERGAAMTPPPAFTTWEPEEPEHERRY